MASAVLMFSGSATIFPRLLICSRIVQKSLSCWRVSLMASATSTAGEGERPLNAEWCDFHRTASVLPFEDKAELGRFWFPQDWDCEERNELMFPLTPEQKNALTQL